MPYSCQGKVKGKSAPTPRGVWPTPAHGQVNPSAKCPHLEARAWVTPWAAPPKLEVIIFFLTIPSMSNAYYQKYNPTPLLLTLQLFMTRPGCYYTCPSHKNCINKISEFRFSALVFQVDMKNGVLVWCQ